MQKPIKAVVLDLDGTLVDTIVDIAAAMKKVASRHGVQADVEALSRKAIGNGGRKLMERVYEAMGIDLAHMEEDYPAYEAVYAAESYIDSAMYDGALALLEGLKTRSIPAVLATHKPSGATHGLIDGLGIREYFAYIFSFDDMQKPKPDPWVVEEAARLLHIEPADIMMVGDSMADVGCGCNAGAVSVAVLGGYADMEKMKICEADYIVESIANALQIIDERNEDSQ